MVPVTLITREEVVKEKGFDRVLITPTGPQGDGGNQQKRTRGEGGIPPL